jgi:ubiquinone/menaquinone biosynthesis C-methylase UbiE
MGKTQVENHFDKVAKDYDLYKKNNKYYYDNLKKLLRKLIPSGKNVLEIGCGTGELLASLNPSRGYGVDVSSEMVKVAKRKYSGNINLNFSTVYPSTIKHQPLDFDYIFMSDVVEHLENPENTFGRISKLMDKKSKLIVTMANPIWEPVLMLAEKLGLKMPEGPHTRLTAGNLKLIIKNSKLKLLKYDYRLLVPVHIPVIADFANRYLEKFLKPLCFIEYFIAVRV